MKHQQSDIINMNALIGQANILFITLDSLRFDVAQEAFNEGITPNFARVLPATGWQQRHTPASFTYPAHQAFFAGFLPTLPYPNREPRLFASSFGASQTIRAETFSFAEATLPEALQARGYRTICIGGVAFFNKRSALGKVLPNLFTESYWQASFAPMSRHSAEKQVACALRTLDNLHNDEKFFLFINFSATHKPSHIFLEDTQHNTQHDSKTSQRAALLHIDQHMPPLLVALAQRGNYLAIICSDHGTTFGTEEDANFRGHRLAHPAVWNVPYLHYLWHNNHITH